MKRGFLELFEEKDVNILYDFEIQIGQRFGGISKYFYEIISIIQKKNGVNTFLPVILPKSYDLARLKGRKPVNSPYRLNDILFAINNIWFQILLRIRKFDVIHQTQYRVRIPNYINSKVCITIHDMIWEIYPETDLGGKRAKNKKAAIDRADEIIAISNNTKRDLLKIYPNIDPNIVHVVHHGTSYTDINYIERAEWVPRRYVLYVGTREYYKNFSIFVAAMKKLMDLDDNIYVICTGEKSFTQEEVILIENSKEEKGKYLKRFIQHKCSDKELIMLYCNAECFVFPSKYEGFGMPILEAYACKCPVVLSNTEIFREVAGDAALYFEPDDPDGLTEVVKTLISDEDLRRDYILRGTERAKLFTWEECAEETFNIYQNMISI